MNYTFGKLCSMTLLLVILVAASLQAQSSEHGGYDITNEVTLDGMVTSVLAKPSPGMVMGSHLLLTTPTGQVDISLGAFGLRGKGAVSVTPGQQIEVTGIMKTMRSKPVFLARTVSVGSKVYAMRNEHGIPVSPQARENASKKAARPGETQ